MPLLLALLTNGKAQTAGADALAKLLSPGTDDSPANHRIQEEIANDGGTAPLLALLSGMNIEAQVHAAEALANLARGNESTQAVIAKAGGVGPLISMLPSKEVRAQAQAASALAQLAKNNKENQGSIARSGGSSCW